MFRDQCQIEKKMSKRQKNTDILNMKNQIKFIILKLFK